jgi:hypothetical protein
MDKKQQAARIERIVDNIAERATAVPGTERSVYIQEEVSKVREAFRQTYEADARLAAYAMEFVDSMTGWINARVHALETERTRVELIREQAEVDP